MRPTVGRIVHFYESPEAKPRAAIVVDTDVIGNPSLRVFAVQGTNDVFYYGVPQRGETSGWFWDWPAIERKLVQSESTEVESLNDGFGMKRG